MQESTFSIQMNGKEYQVEPGQTILNVAQSQDYFVPSVCYHPNLGSIQTCDTCFVQREWTNGKGLYNESQTRDEGGYPF